jgi:hypothetical protein
MPKTSDNRARDVEKLNPVLDVLNGHYSYLRMIKDIRDVEGKDPLESDPDSAFLYVDAANRLRGALVGWVEEWRKTKLPSAGEDRENYVAEYLYGNRTARKEFIGVSKRIGLPENIPRQLFAFQPRGQITGDQHFKLRVAIFRYLFESGFLSSYSRDLGLEFATTFFSSDDPLLGAEAEAIHLFILLLRSELSTQLRRCPAKDCGRYFLNLGGRREFCSRAHAQQRINMRALQNLKQDRDRRKLQAIDRANKALEKCKTKNWKPWVAKKTGLTKAFLTRNINNLKVPKKFGREE